MVKAWLMDDSDEDQRLEHQRMPPVPISIEEIKERTGVLYGKFDPERDSEALEALKKERGYTYEDAIEVSPDKLPNYDATIKNFYKEHIHTDEEIRYVVAGSGYFDVRDKNEDWIRIAMEPADLIVLPAGIYHRFTLDSKNYIKAKRFFVGEPVWTPHYRPADDMECRKKYVKNLQSGFAAIPNLA